MPRETPALTEQEYWHMYESVREDVSAAIASNHAHQTIHTLGALHPHVFNKYQRHAHFWIVNTYALQTTFFIAFGRIFDTRRDTYSVQRLVAATIANPTLFSKQALRARKRTASHLTGNDPQWLVQYFTTAWEPTSADLQPLHTALTPHHAKFKALYQPLRHQYFAHHGTGSKEAISALFSKALRADVVDILGFLHTTLWAIQELASNATPLNLTNRDDYNNHITYLDGQVEGFINTLS